MGIGVIGILLSTFDIVASVQQAVAVFAILIQYPVVIAVYVLREMIEHRVYSPVILQPLDFWHHRTYRPVCAGHLGKSRRFGKLIRLYTEYAGSIILRRFILFRRTRQWMNGIPVEIHVLQSMGVRIEEFANGITFALSEDAVGGDVRRCAALPDDASGTMALVADEQAGKQVRT